MAKRGGIRDSFGLRKIPSIKTKSQVAVELVVVLSFILVIFLALIAINQKLMSSTSGQLRSTKAKVVLNDLGKAAKQVYQQGVGAQTRVFVSIPNGVETSSVSDQTISLSFGSGTQTNDVYKNLNFQVTGNIPTQEGNYWLTVKSRQGYVVIGFSLIDIFPGGFSKTLIAGNSSNDKISLKNVIQEHVNIELSYSGDPNLNVDLSHADLLLSSDQVINVTVTISALSSSQPGVYTGTIQINANTSTESQITFLPVLLTVVPIQSSDPTPNILLYPENWNTGVIGVDRLYSKLFYICSNLFTTQSIDLSFSNNAYLGFDQGVSSKIKTMNILAKSCNTTYVYLNTTNSVTGPYTSQLLADTGTDSDTSTISFNIGEDTSPPEINLISPQDNSSVLLGNLVFSYNVSDFASDIASCKLIINNSVVDTDNSIQEETIQDFTLLGLGNGDYTWTINCTDDSPNANQGTGGARNLIVNFTTVYATPELAFEEDYDPQWITEVQILNDGIYATAQDEGPPAHSNYPPPDHVEFDFPSLGISEDYGIDTVILTIRHYENMQSGWFDMGDRHQIECYNGVEWVAIETWQWTPEFNMTWINYVSSDLSTCISIASLANDIHIRMTYDPADDTGALQYIDWAQVEVNISTAYYSNLWELIIDGPQPLDFSSGINTTNNSFGINAGDDGWDWQEDPYGGGESSAKFNVDPNMDGNTADSTVASNDRIEVRVGGGAPGAQANADDDTYNGPASSGAYGIQFEITTELYNKILNGGKAQLSFDWFGDEDGGWDNGLDSGDEAWIKARLITPTTTIWLGSDLDIGDNDADANNEIWFMDDPIDDSGHESIDITNYISSEGTYYLDFGAAVGDWDTSKEGFGAYFDNIMLIIIQ